MTEYDMLYLTACALNGTMPDSEKIAGMHLEQLFSVCQFHSLTAVVCMTLEDAGVQMSPEWSEAKAKAICKNILMDVERFRICTFMEENGIWHLPLKGVILKELYPKLGMRQMSDNDILYDKTYQKQLLAFMKASGYTPKEIGKTYDDVYMKPPVYHFEMHTQLFAEGAAFYPYYANIREKLIPEDGKTFGMRFTDEDFYIYLVAHEYKHYTLNGTGLRALADRYVYTKAKPDMNQTYIRTELEKLGILEFEQETRALLEKVFANPLAERNARETELLEFYLFSGTYGTFEHRVRNKRKNDSRLTYLRKWLFPDMQFYQLYYPFFYRHKWLLPVGWTFRLVRAVFFRRKRISAEWKALRASENEHQTSAP